MPHSGTLLDGHARGFLTRLPFERAIDIGAGAGKYGRMIRAIKPTVHLTALECEVVYCQQFGLNQIYDRVLAVDALDLLQDVDATYDLVILGDVIEHLPKSDGIDLLHYLVYRTRYFLIQYPTRYLQGALDGHKSEAHLSVWKRHEFEDLFDGECVVWEQLPLTMIAATGYPADAVQVRSLY